MKESFKGWQIFDYYQWLLEKVDGHLEPYYNYSLLLNKLHSIEYTWSIEHDSNRATDGMILRRIYMDENNIPDIFYSEAPCSVLEMMIGLAVRCEIEIMGVSGEDNTAKWFWIMVENLDLMRCTDENFNGEYVEQQVRIFLDRSYKRNGIGGIFPLKHTKLDQRKLEIWRQMNGYLCENFV